MNRNRNRNTSKDRVVVRIPDLLEPIHVHAIDVLPLDCQKRLQLHLEVHVTIHVVFDQGLHSLGQLVVCRHVGLKLGNEGVQQRRLRRIVFQLLFAVHAPDSLWFPLKLIHGGIQHGVERFVCDAQGLVPAWP